MMNSAKAIEIVKQLKTTPLANPIDEHGLEEVAIWASMNITSYDDLIEVIYAITQQYMTRVDMLDSFLSISPKYRTKSNYAPKNVFFSKRAFFWLFSLISKTDVLDEFVCTPKFKKFALDMKQTSSKQIQLKTSYAIEHYSPRISGDLFEIFAELLDILQNKQ